MNSRDRLLTHWANILVIGTGLVYGAIRYWPGGGDEFSAVSPSEPLWRGLHLFVAPALVFASGLIWKNHVLRQLNKKESGPNRWSGISLILILVPMILSGVLLQCVTSDLSRQVFVALHWITGTVWAVSFLLHFLFARKLSKFP